MRLPDKRTGGARRLRGFVAVALAAALALTAAAAKPPVKHPPAGHAAAKENDDGAAAARRQQQLQADRRELRARLAQLKKQLATTEAAHSDVADSLAESETAISAANRRLRELAQARRQIERQIAALQERQRSAAHSQSSHEVALGLALRSEWLLTQRSDWRTVLDGRSPDETGRTAAYLGYLVRERAHRIEELHGRREELAALESASRDKQDALTSIAGDERADRAQLLKQQSTRKQTLARLARDLTRQRQSVDSLERDETRLAAVIEQLDKVLEEQARRRAAQAAAARARSNTAAERFEPPASNRFAQLRGRLQLPVKGEVVSRFGSARRGDDGAPQPGAPTWKGLFIRAEAGEDVHAVAAGRVVFADWLRGFGNLMIVDHGDGFLSVYGNNETLLRSIGDQVESGDVIAAAGNTGGNAQSGLYFEMRYQGRPFDPLAWVALR